jgi:sugar O-acyltransferase (sialic acid O-acetyltransferase NeuD family)
MSSNQKKLLIIGPGGHSRVVIDAALSAGFNLEGIIDPEYSGKKETILGVPVLGDVGILDEIDPEHVSVFVAIGSNSKREEWILLVTEKGFSTPAIQHPSAIVSPNAEIEDAVFINTGVIINAGARIGSGSIINTGVIIDHETLVGRCVHVAPGCKISGRVTIGNGTFIGVGTTVIDYINIGEKAMIGAGSVIIKDIASRTTVVGIPGRVIK